MAGVVALDLPAGPGFVAEANGCGRVGMLCCRWIRGSLHRHRPSLEIPAARMQTSSRVRRGAHQAAARPPPAGAVDIDRAGRLAGLVRSCHFLERSPTCFPPSLHTAGGVTPSTHLSSLPAWQPAPPRTAPASGDASAAAPDTTATAVDDTDPAERVGDYLDGRVLDIVPRTWSTPPGGSSTSADRRRLGRRERGTIRLRGRRGQCRRVGCPVVRERPVRAPSAWGQVRVRLCRPVPGAPARSQARKASACRPLRYRAKTSISQSRSRKSSGAHVVLQLTDHLCVPAEAELRLEAPFHGSRSSSSNHACRV